MKKIFCCMSLLVCCITVHAQSNDRFQNAMKKNLAAMDTVFRNPASLVSMANNFERIAVAEKTQWLPYYYAAFCQVNYAFMEQDKSKTDPIADKADQLIRQADSLMPGNSEINCLRSMIASARLMVNPMERYMQYGPESEKYLQMAMSQDDTNPRPYYLKGQSMRYTPEQFGGGCKAAKPVLETAMEKYGKFKPASELHPSWGMEQTSEVLKACL